MKRILVIASLIAPLCVQSLEYEKQFENEQVRVSRVAMAAGEEMGLHRDENPRIVIGLQGGTIKRIERDGSANEIHFPKGGAVFLEADPVGEIHRAVNISDHVVEVVVVELKAKG
jgi:quercetin dioxygenase-like cupin family protein